MGRSDRFSVTNIFPPAFVCIFRPSVLYGSQLLLAYTIVCSTCSQKLCTELVRCQRGYINLPNNGKGGISQLIRITHSTAIIAVTVHFSGYLSLIWGSCCGDSENCRYCLLWVWHRKVWYKFAIFLEDSNASCVCVLIHYFFSLFLFSYLVCAIT